MTRRVALTIAWLFVLALGLRAQEAGTARSPVLSRVIGLSVTLNLPVRPCTVPSLTLALAKHLRVPAGAEQLPGPCDWGTPVEIADRIPLIGLTFGEALELMVKADPRYYALENDGVVVVRPLAAWSKRDHFLHRAIDRLELRDDNIGGALHAVLAPLRGKDSGLGSQLMSADPTLLNLSLGPISIVEGLDAIVRAHGAARWQVNYCVPEIATDVAQVFLMTYDDRGIGTGASRERRRSPDGKIIMCPH